jgi:hypothetical protein
VSRQVFDGECSDAGAFVLQMRARPDVYTAWTAAHRAPWAAVHAEPNFRRIEHLCYIIFRTIEHECCARHGRPTREDLRPRDLKPRDFSEFRATMLKGKR